MKKKLSIEEDLKEKLLEEIDRIIDNKDIITLILEMAKLIKILDIISESENIFANDEEGDKQRHYVDYYLNDDVKHTTIH